MTAKLNSIIRITMNNFSLPILEILWFYLGYLGVFDALIADSGSHGMGMPIDWVFLIASQIILLLVYVNAMKFKRPKLLISNEKYEISTYYSLSFIGPVIFLIILAIEINLSLLHTIFSIFIVGIIVASLVFFFEKKWDGEKP